MTLHDLATDQSWMKTHPDGFMIVGSNATWEQAEYGPRGGLKISRLVPNGSRVKQISRYVDPETFAVLIEPYHPEEDSHEDNL